jgi:hypothetical protein
MYTSLYGDRVVSGKFKKHRGKICIYVEIKTIRYRTGGFWFYE